MEQIAEPTVNTTADPLGVAAPAVPEVLVPATHRWSDTCLLDDHAQAAFHVRAELRKLSAQCLESRPWPFHWYRNRLYRHLLSGYCGLLPDLAKDENHEYLSAALMGLKHIHAKNLAISMTILRDIKFHIVPGESIVYVLKGLFYFVVGASSVTYLAIVLLHSAMSGGITEPILNVLLAFIFGLLGSVVSLLNRISRLDQAIARSQAYCVFTGATSPIVGGISAAG